MQLNEVQQWGGAEWSGLHVECDTSQCVHMSMYIESFQIKSPQHAICKKVIIHVSEICV